MKKRFSENEKRCLMILLSVFAVAAIVYMVICDYAGISGKIAFLQQKVFYISRYFGIANYPYWLIHATFSGILGVLCIYALYRMKSAKKRYGTLVLCLFLPYFVNVHFQPDSEGLWAITFFMSLFLGTIFALVNIPGRVSRAVTRCLISQPSDLKFDAEALCLRKLKQMEWICFFPLKKAVIGTLWLSILAFGLLGIVSFCEDPQRNFLTIGLFFLAIAAVTAQKAWLYIITPCHCVPVLNKMFSKKQIQSLLQGEQFEMLPFENELLQKYTPILLSENWALVEGLLISRKLLIKGEIDCSKRGSRRASWIKITYLNGQQFQTRKTDIYLDTKQRREMQSALYHIAGIHSHICASEKIAQKYDAILPEIQDSKEKLWYLLTNDISGIKDAYEAMFAPAVKRNKRSQKDAIRKRIR